MIWKHEEEKNGIFKRRWINFDYVRAIAILNDEVCEILFSDRYKEVRRADIEPHIPKDFILTKAEGYNDHWINPKYINRIEVRHGNCSNNGIYMIGLDGCAFVVPAMNGAEILKKLTLDYLKKLELD